MKQQKIGYVEVVFKDNEKKQIIDWTSSIKQEDIYTTIIEGKIEGGNLTDKLHLTLFYGLDSDNLNKSKILEFINNIKIDEIELGALGTFPVSGYDCKILYISVKDTDKILNKIHEDFKSFSYFTKYQQEQYTPHITLAYVRDTFDYKKMSPLPVKKLLADKIKYHIKEK